MPTAVCALGPDNAGPVLEELLLSAAHRLRIAVYEIGPSWAALLARRAREGIATEVLVDAHSGANTAAARVLQGSGAAVRALPRGSGAGGGRAEAHWKLILADDSTLAVGTGNLIARDAPRPHGMSEPLRGTREWWITVDACPSLVGRAAATLAAAWESAVDVFAVPLPLAEEAIPPIGAPAPAVSPLRTTVPVAALDLRLGGAEVHQLLAARIGAARRRALVTVPYVHLHVAAVTVLTSALAAVAARGADARLLLGGVPPAEQREQLDALGVPIRVMDPLRCTTGHAKGAVLDDLAVVSSANWSAAGLGPSREAALAIRNPAAAEYYAATFDRDWSTATPRAR